MIDASSPDPGISPFHLEPTESKHMRLIDLTVHIPGQYRALPQEPAPSRWKTIEFRIYAVFIFIIVLIMGWIPITLSSLTHPNYPRFRSRLSQGWMFGRPVDNSDAQYRGFRNNFIPLTLAAGAFLLAKFVRTRLHTAAPNSRDNMYLLPFNFGASIVMLVALHGTSALKIFAILTGNYLISKSCGGSKSGPICSWIFNAVVLFLNDRYSGYRFGDLVSSLAFLDSFEGIYPRWHSATGLNEKQRQVIAHPDAVYSYPNYHRKPLSIPRSTILGYSIRFLISLLTMEFILHFMYVVAIKDTKAWIAMIGFWNLIIVWLKVRLMFKHDTCMANNYSVFGFWRSWHRSYNLWILRYIYIPVGGTNNVVLNTLLAFTFVALWHDLTFRLLAWGWLVSLFIVPELAARYVFPQSRYGHEPWYRHACAVGAVLNMIMMMAANLVGFVLGIDGTKFFVQQLFGTAEGMWFLVGALCYR
ncbi:glycerol transporter [Mycena leptocephala]|nr:glycerol transporter [Mycena leptocephala]